MEDSDKEQEARRHGLDTKTGALDWSARRLVSMVRRGFNLSSGRKASGYQDLTAAPCAKSC
ncbi:hypothetical protein CFAM422_004177 [Trichoderma lentiforme]|uniref:Uncharacterized protein n=1 Tax=Trichoderma lentiforme TaxID=1567552 RepID=A0A9P5CFJ6_9HYPO|nr:hypothetical protein CFAM422_004177 [Trichoderma lentiforme]